MKMFKHLAVAVMAAGIVFVTATTADPEDWEPEPLAEAPPAHAGRRLNDPTYGCWKKEHIEELRLAVRRGDERQYEYLVFTLKCLPLSSMEYSLIKKHAWRGIAKVRVWDSERKKGGLIFWVWPAPTE